MSARKLFWIALAVSIALSALILALGPQLNRFSHLPDKGPAWYYWQLPAPQMWARVTAWGGYALHQITIWYIVYRAWRKRRDPQNPDRAGALNIFALGASLFFVLLHLVQTHIWYDGLAQDVPIWTSQFSVIIMLVIILLMLIPRRGIFWGRRVRVPEKVSDFVRDYHGFYIAWALVYTFWFHPMEGEWGLLIGFLYMFFLFIQLSMFNTWIHFSLPWIALLEFFVGVHGPMIAILNGQEAWPMFLFGFLFMTVGTQIHGLSLGRWTRAGIAVLYVVGAIVVYAFRGYGKVYEIVFIPSALYGGTLALAIVIGVGIWLAGGFRSTNREPG